MPERRGHLAQIHGLMAHDQDFIFRAVRGVCDCENEVLPMSSEARAHLYTVVNALRELRLGP
jgi:hypothetical protein